MFNNACNSTTNAIVQNPVTGTVTVTFTALAAGDYFISLKYNAGSIKGAAAPNPQTVHYNFATTGVPGSTSGIDLIRQ